MNWKRVLCEIEAEEDRIIALRGHHGPDWLLHMMNSSCGIGVQRDDLARRYQRLERLSQKVGVHWFKHQGPDANLKVGCSCSQHPPVRFPWRRSQLTYRSWVNAVEFRQQKEQHV